jgi:hypothetical protein
MNPFKAFKKKIPGTSEPPVIHQGFPEVNSFVYVTIGVSEEFLPIESVASSSFAIRCPKNAEVGDKVPFAYVSGTRRFGFTAACTHIEDRTATFVRPQDITLVGTFSDRRHAFRIKCVIPVLFRFAPNGVGSGEFVETSVADISIIGASMLLPAEPTEGECVEITFELKGQGEPFRVIADVSRPGHAQPSGRVLAGLTFHDLGERDAKAIDNFMVQFRHGIRERSLALHDG